MSALTTRDPESAALVMDVGEGKAQKDGKEKAAVETHLLPHIAYWGLGICSLLAVILYSVALMHEQFRVIPRNCAIPSSGNVWPTSTANYYQSTYAATDITENAWWYFKGEWTVKNLGDGVLCPLTYYDESFGECSVRKTCSDKPNMCMNKDGSAVTAAVISIGILDTWKLLLKYRNVWEAAVPVMSIMWLICFVYATCIDMDVDSLDKNAKHAWFAAFKPFVNHMGFDKDRVWKQGGHKSQFWNMILQFLCSILFVVFIWVQWGSYAAISDVFLDMKTYKNIFVSNPSGGVYCKSVYVEDTATGFFAAALLFATFSLLIEVYCLVHIYIKASNGGIFRDWFGCYPTIVVNASSK